MTYSSMGSHFAGTAFGLRVLADSPPRLARRRVARRRSNHQRQIERRFKTMFRVVGGPAFQPRAVLAVQHHDDAIRPDPSRSGLKCAASVPILAYRWLTLLPWPKKVDHEGTKDTK